MGCFYEYVLVYELPSANTDPDAGPVGNIKLESMKSTLLHMSHTSNFATRACTYLRCRVDDVDNAQHTWTWQACASCNRPDAGSMVELNVHISDLQSMLFDACDIFQIMTCDIYTMHSATLFCPTERKVTISSSLPGSSKYAMLSAGGNLRMCRPWKEPGMIENLVCVFRWHSEGPGVIVPNL